MIFSRNNTSGMQQHTPEKLKTVVFTYPHRRDEHGHPLMRIRFVRSTAEPDFRYTSFNAWCMRVKREVMTFVKIGGANGGTD